MKRKGFNAASKSATLTVCRCYQPAAARELSVCPPSTHLGPRGPPTHAPTLARVFLFLLVPFSFFFVFFFSFFFNVISNSHLLFHERCNTLMRAPTISLSKKKVEVGVDRLGAREAPRPPSRLCSEPFAFCTLPPKP